MSSRVIVVALRLPVAAKLRDGRVVLERSPGGVASGIRNAVGSRRTLLIGWLGPLRRMPGQSWKQTLVQMATKGYAPVELDGTLAQRFYEGYANGVLWPVLHSLPGLLPLHIDTWDDYCRANQLFADAIIREYRFRDLVWVHDYQLLLVPEFLRRRRSDARIGLFLHVPFPPLDTFRVIPQRTELLRGMLGADLIGFHTHGYLREFISALSLVPEARVTGDRLVEFGGRTIRLGAFAMGVDVERFERLAESVEETGRVERLRRGNHRIILGVDRLDYTKGVPRRLLAFDALLRRHPEWRERLRFIQVAVPSREHVPAYASFTEETERIIGKLHGDHATANWAPLHYVHRSLDVESLVALYRAADVLVVTPLRDGMNLVAKEFVASRTDEDGVLVLSEFAGAARELAEAIHVNPFDVDATGEAMHRALSMSVAERSARMRALRQRVKRQDLTRWGESFLKVLDTVPEWRRGDDADVVGDILRAMARRPAIFLLDYDGTLVPHTFPPDAAVPDAELLETLARLCALPRARVAVVSGRPRAFLSRHLGHLPMDLIAEHGAWWRSSSTHRWKRSAGQPGKPAWKEAVRPVLERATRDTPGSLLEEKETGFAWHWRGADPALGEARARSLAYTLPASLPEEAALIEGDCVIEVRQSGVTKAVAARRLAERAGRQHLVVAFGNDTTDSELFAVLPADAITVWVGGRPGNAKYHIPTVEAGRAVLRAIASSGLHVDGNGKSKARKKAPKPKKSGKAVK